MRSKFFDTYLIIIFSIINFSNWSFTVQGFDIIGLFIWIVSLGIFLWEIVPLLKKGIPKPTTEIIFVLVYFVCEVLLILYNLFFEKDMGFRSPLMLSILFISLTLLIEQNYKSRFLFWSSIINLMVDVICFLCALGIFEKPPFAQGILNDASFCSWLIMGLCISILGYCTEASMKIWYAFCLLIGALALFLEKNALSILIVSIMFLVATFAFAGNYQKVKNILILYFAYVFLFANMSLIVNYGPHLVRVTPYSIETSVYMELLIFLVAVFLCHIDDRWAKKGLKSDVITKYIRVITLAIFSILITGVITFIIINLFAAPEMIPTFFSKISNYLSQDMAQVRNSWETSLLVQRIVLLLTAVYYIAMAILYTRKVFLKGNPCKVYICLGLIIVYLLQFICLPQSLEVNLLYGVVLFWEFAGQIEEKEGFS